MRRRYEVCALLVTLDGYGSRGCNREEVRRRCEEQIAAGQDEISRMTAKQAVAEKALEVGAAQVAQLKQALGEQSSHLSSTEMAFDLLKASSKLAVTMSKASRQICAGERGALGVATCMWFTTLTTQKKCSRVCGVL